jgi:2-polyprenyl-3-methyl-5-hydroxy-6-metoxy-1,4-benzoquinol methylase
LNNRNKIFSVTAILIIVGAGLALSQQTRSNLDILYEPSPTEVVDEMLKLARLQKNDVVYDLGCGDGRIVIAAAKKYGASGVGIDIDPKRIEEARINAKKAGVEDNVKFFQQDLFKTELRDATVVMLYLHYDLNLRLRPKLWKELHPGARVVSSTFDMGNWKPDATSLISGRNIYLWIIK